MTTDESVRRFINGLLPQSQAQLYKLLTLVRVESFNAGYEVGCQQQQAKWAADRIQQHFDKAAYGAGCDVIKERFGVDVSAELNHGTPERRA